MTFWDSPSPVFFNGPVRVSTYKEYLEETIPKGMMVPGFNMKTEVHLIKWGHIITRDSEGNTIIYCKKSFWKKGKHRIPIPPTEPVVITETSVIAAECPVCLRYVKVRESYFKNKWYFNIKMPSVML